MDDYYETPRFYEQQRELREEIQEKADKDLEDRIEDKMTAGENF